MRSVGMFTEVAQEKPKLRLKRILADVIRNDPRNNTNLHREV